jgi:hypothetical protein
VIVVTRPEDAATWLEKDLLHALGEHFGVPVRHLVDDDAFRAAHARGEKGRSAS